MKRPYYRKRDAAGWNATMGWGAVIIATLLIAAIRLIVPGTFVALTASLARVGATATAGVGTLFVGFESNAQLARENAALMQENESLRNENGTLTARAQDLTRLLGSSGAAQAVVTAGVLARPPESPYDTLIVGAGSADGAAVGAEVFAQGGVPIGTLKHVYAHSAQVSLFSSPARMTSGWVGTDRIALSLTGMGAGAFSASLPAGAAAAVGDSVYVPGPGALPIGTITKVDTDPSSPTEVIHVQPIVNLFSVTWVQIAR